MANQSILDDLLWFIPDMLANLWGSSGSSSWWSSSKNPYARRPSRSYSWSSWGNRWSLFSSPKTKKQQESEKKQKQMIIEQQKRMRAIQDARQATQYAWRSYNFWPSTTKRKNIFDIK